MAPKAEPAKLRGPDRTIGTVGGPPPGEWSGQSGTPFGPFDAPRGQGRSWYMHGTRSRACAE